MAKKKPRRWVQGVKTVYTYPPIQPRFTGWPSDTWA